MHKQLLRATLLAALAVPGAAPASSPSYSEREIRDGVRLVERLVRDVLVLTRAKKDALRASAQAALFSEAMHLDRRAAALLFRNDQAAWSAASAAARARVGSALSLAMSQALVLDPLEPELARMERGLARIANLDALEQSVVPDCRFDAGYLARIRRDVPVAVEPRIAPDGSDAAALDAARGVFRVRAVLFPELVDTCVGRSSEALWSMVWHFELKRSRDGRGLYVHDIYQPDRTRTSDALQDSPSLRLHLLGTLLRPMVDQYAEALGLQARMLAAGPDTPARADDRRLRRAALDVERIMRTKGWSELGLQLVQAHGGPVSYGAHP